jgi:hypothetical protein
MPWCISCIWGGAHNSLSVTPSCLSFIWNTCKEYQCTGVPVPAPWLDCSPGYSQFLSKRFQFSFLCRTLFFVVLTFANITSNTLHIISSPLMKIDSIHMWRWLFWDIATCSLVEIDQCFGGDYCLRHQGDSHIHTLHSENLKHHSFGSRITGSLWLPWLPW